MRQQHFDPFFQALRKCPISPADESSVSDETDIAWSSGFVPKKRLFSIVLAENSLAILAMGPSVFNSILEFREVTGLSPAGAVAPVFHIQGTGSGMRRQYSVMPSPHRNAFTDAEQRIIERDGDAARSALAAAATQATSAEIAELWSQLTDEQKMPPRERAERRAQEMRESSVYNDTMGVPRNYGNPVGEQSLTGGPSMPVLFPEGMTRSERVDALVESANETRRRAGVDPIALFDDPPAQAATPEQSEAEGRDERGERDDRFDALMGSVNNMLVSAQSSSPEADRPSEEEPKIDEEGLTDRINQAIEDEDIPDILGDLDDWNE
jgi:hypothetical protein